MFLCDGTRQAKAATGLTEDLVQRPLTSLLPADRELWRALVGSRDIWSPRRSPAWQGHFWTRVIAVHEAPCSQFDTLRDLLSRGLVLAGPVACLAVTGRRFHGHRGREWVAAPGNLHLCIALPLSLAADLYGLSLTMLPAVAVVDAIRHATDGALAPAIKWVNDILLAGRKVAGVLTVTQTSGNRLDHAILGVGLNVAVAPSLAATPFVPAVGSLQAEPVGKNLTLPEMLQAVLNALANRYHELVQRGPEPLFTAYREACLVLGRRVCIWAEDQVTNPDPATWPPPLVTGVVADIARDLSLRLHGHTQPVTKGRLALADACPFLD